MTLYQVFTSIFGLVFIAVFLCCDIYDLLVYPEPDVLFGNSLDIIEIVFTFGCYIWLLVKFAEAF